MYVVIANAPIATPLTGLVLQFVFHKKRKYEYPST